MGDQLCQRFVSSVNLAESFPVSNGRFHRAASMADAICSQLTSDPKTAGAAGQKLQSSNKDDQQQLQLNARKPARISGGIGHELMQKMGWRAGEGLGKLSDGTVEPVAVKVKNDRVGLASQEEHVHLTCRKQPPARAERHRANNSNAGQQQQSSRAHHQAAAFTGRQMPRPQQQQQQQQSPVSQLMEFAQRERFYPMPQFYQRTIRGSPSAPHTSQFLVCVKFLDRVFEPRWPSRSKKAAKAAAAALVLERLGLVP